MDMYSMLKGYPVPGVVTGKPIEIGGSQGRGAATGRGVMFVTREILAKLGKSAKGARVAVQGMGNVGGTAARFLAQEGMKVVAVSDVSGGIYCEDGLDMEAVYAHTSQRKLLSSYEAPGIKRISGAEVLTVDVDILVPAALENQLTADNAYDVKASIIVEGANGPTTVEADKIFAERGIHVVPDILANSGGVVVSYFEWVQNLQSMYWDEDEVNAKLERNMKASFAEVWNKAQQYNTTLRIGANMVAIERLVKAYKARGGII